jgi:hypothetical protein
MRLFATNASQSGNQCVAFFDDCCSGQLKRGSLSYFNSNASRIVAWEMPVLERHGQNQDVSGHHSPSDLSRR